MTTLANVKGYINGNEWGVYEPTPKLMTAQELCTTYTTHTFSEGKSTIPISSYFSYSLYNIGEYNGEGFSDVVTELNSNAIGYYNKLLQDGSIIDPSSDNFFDNSARSVGYILFYAHDGSADAWTGVYYNTSNNIWVAYNASGPE